MSRRASSRGGIRALAWVGGAVVALLLASLLDAPIARAMARHPFGYSFDLYTLLRLAGYLPLWAVVSLAFAAIDAPSGWRAVWSRGGVLFLAVTIAGVLAEILKVLVRRERPSTDLAMYVFRPWRESPFSSSGLGWPSSHTAVAFARGVRAVPAAPARDPDLASHRHRVRVLATHEQPALPQRRHRWRHGGLHRRSRVRGARQCA